MMELWEYEIGLYANQYLWELGHDAKFTDISYGNHLPRD